MLTFAIKKKRTPSIAPKRYAPTVSPMSHSLHLQQEKVRHILRGSTLQPKLTIGQPNDKYEQEADRVADEVMRMPEPRLQRQVEPEEEKKEEETLQPKPLANQITPLAQVQRQEEPEEEEETLQAKALAEQISPLVQRRAVEEEGEEEPLQTKLVDEAQLQRQEEEEEEKEEDETLQPKEVSCQTPEVTPAIESQIQLLKDGGQPLPKFARTFFEPRFGHDFSQVRIHTGGQASESARKLNARAFTVGRDVVFGAGQYSPGTSEGQRLLAHELTHVAQQKNSRKTLQRQSEPSVEKHEYGEEYEEYAKLLKKAMEGWGTEEEQIFEALQKVHSRPTAIASLKKAYKNKYGTSLEDDLRDEMSGSELDFALTLLGKKPSKEVEVVPRTFSEDDYTRAVDRLVDAMEGPGTNEELIYAVLVPFAGAFGSIRKLKAAYKRKAKRTLEEDLESELSGDELEYALKLLHAPLKPAKGMPERILAQAERETAPGTPCTVASIKRYVRSYLDYYYLDGQLNETELLRAEAPHSEKYADARSELQRKLKSLLGPVGEQYLDGGPTENVGNVILRTLRHTALFGGVKGRRFYRLWQIISASEGEELGHGAIEALATRGLGEKLMRPATREPNIKGILWDEILRPGAVIQTWSTVKAATTFSCPASKRFGGVCGHSFIFVDYVYSSQESPPKDKPRSWPLYGGSGTPLSTGGEVYSVRKPLVEMKYLYIVGMRIIDQRGYHFIPKDAGNINNKVLPDNVGRVRWLAQSDVWLAAQLA